MRTTITLLSDLGCRDASVMTVKAILLRYVPEAAIIDLTHEAEPFDLLQAAYLLAAAYKYFPQGAIHIALTDVFAGPAPRMLLAKAGGFYFLAPDNGVLPLTLGDNPVETRLCRDFPRPHVFNDWVACAGEAARDIIGGGADKYPLAEIREKPRVLQPKLLPDGVECNVLYIDHYENVVLDITQSQFRGLVAGRPFVIRVSRTVSISAISNNYSDAGRGQPLCRFNSEGYLEIAYNHDKAASRLGLGVYKPGALLYKTIRITFGAAPPAGV